MSLTFPLRLLLCLLLGAAAGAEPLRVPVHSVASDAVYLGLGASSGLAAGMRGTLAEGGGRSVELEVLFVSAGRASCRVNPAGAEVRVGDVFLFDVPAAGAVADSVAFPAKPPVIPPEGVAAIARAAAARGPRARGWWRADLAVSRDGAQSGLLSRQALGLRAGLAQWKGVDLSLQVRHRSQWKPATAQEGWLDELALSGPMLHGTLAWEAGRLADGRNALAGPMDGVSLERADKADWAWGLSAGSRAGALGEAADRALGAGGRLRYSARKSPLASDLKARLEHDPDGVATAGASWSNQLRLREALRVEQWVRVERSEASDWRRNEALFSSERLRWQGPVWQAEARHQGSSWPLQPPEERVAGVADTLGNRLSQQVAFSLARQVRGDWMQAQLQARGERLDAEMERLLLLGWSRAFAGHALSRINLSGQLLLGPEDAGQDLEARMSLAPARWPELELGLRGWRMDLGLEQWSGWNGSLFARGQWGSALRWEMGGLLQRAQGNWERELRLSLRGDLRLRPRTAAS